MRVIHVRIFHEINHPAMGVPPWKAPGCPWGHLLHLGPGLVESGLEKCASRHLHRHKNADVIWFIFHMSHWYSIAIKKKETIQSYSETWGFQVHWTSWIPPQYAGSHPPTASCHHLGIDWIAAWLRTNGIPSSGNMVIPHILGGMTPKLVIKQQGSWALLKYLICKERIFSALHSASRHAFADGCVATMQVELFHETMRKWTKEQRRSNKICTWWLCILVLDPDIHITTDTMSFIVYMYIYIYIHIYIYTL